MWLKLVSHGFDVVINAADMTGSWGKTEPRFTSAETLEIVQLPLNLDSSKKALNSDM